MGDILLPKLYYKRLYERLLESIDTFNEEELLAITEPRLFDQLGSHLYYLKQKKNAKFYIFNPREKVRTTLINWFVVSGVHIDRSLNPRLNALN